MLEVIILISLAVLTWSLLKKVEKIKDLRGGGIEFETKSGTFNVLKIALDRIKYLYKPTVLDNLKLAISHPKRLSKGHSSLFKLTIFPPDQQEKVIRLIEESMK